MHLVLRRGFESKALDFSLMCGLNRGENEINAASNILAKKEGWHYWKQQQKYTEAFELFMEGSRQIN